MGSLIPLDGNLPGHLANRRASGVLDNMRAGVQASFAVVGYKGKVWRVKHRGQETPLRDARGQPMPTLDVVILGASQYMAKIYYEKQYVEGDDSAPDCFSLDGITPDATAPKKQNDLCQTCARNKFGSRITDAGKRAKECQDSRRVAVVPLGDIPNEMYGGPMLLRIPPMSLPNLAGYADFLQRKGADVPWVGTQLAFDLDSAYPRITFTATGWLDEEQAAQVEEAMATPQVERILYDFGPTEQAPAAAAEPEIAGKPPAQARGATVTPIRGRASSPSTPVVEPDPEPAPTGEPGGEPQPDRGNPEPAEEAPPAAAPRNPFQAATRPAAPAAAPATAQRQRRVNPQPVPAAAPMELEEAIDDLLDQPA